MRKIKLKSGVNHAMLSTSEMKSIVGGIDEILHCNCRLNINEKDESGNYKSIDVSEQMDMFSVLSWQACSAACGSACDAYSGCLMGVYEWGFGSGSGGGSGSGN